jgi:hypothetical protein
LIWAMPSWTDGPGSLVFAIPSDATC